VVVKQATMRSTNLTRPGGTPVKEEAARRKSHVSCRGNCLVCFGTLESTPLQFSRDHGSDCLVCEGRAERLRFAGLTKHAGLDSSRWWRWWLSLKAAG
jgi:hypothetical protein